MAVDISFNCIPLRALGRFDPPVDATDEQRNQWNRLHTALNTHGAFNTFYLCDGRCIFHLTNHEIEGMLSFKFEGTVLTDAADQKTIGSDLQIELEEESCDWLTAAAVQWLQETTERAICVEFDRYVSAGDLQKTIDRLQQLEAEKNAHGGYLGMGL
ncbi:MAG: hypothetical protein ACWGMZ_04935 [Thermoguttaceae bacterium]